MADVAEAARKHLETARINTRDESRALFKNKIGVADFFALKSHLNDGVITEYELAETRLILNELRAPDDTTEKAVANYLQAEESQLSAQSKLAWAEGKSPPRRAGGGHAAPRGSLEELISNLR